MREFLGLSRGFQGVVIVGTRCPLGIRRLLVGDGGHTVGVGERASAFIVQHAVILAALAEVITFRKDIGVLRQGKTKWKLFT